METTSPVMFAPPAAAQYEERQDDPAGRGRRPIPGRQDDDAHVPLGQIEVEQDLGDDRHGADGHRRREEEGEDGRVGGVGDVPRRHLPAEDEAGRERNHHPEDRRGERRPAEVLEEPHVGLDAGEQHAAVTIPIHDTISSRWNCSASGGKIARKAPGQ